MFAPFPLRAVRRSPATFALLLAAGCTGGTLLAANPDARPSPKQAVESAEALLEEALVSEIYGLDAERDALLSKAEALAPDLPAVKWQRGMLLVDGKWTPAEEVAVPPPSDSLLAEYVAKRDALEESLADHLALARWCQEEKLFEQERAHLARVLKFDPNHAHARVRLGYVRVEDEWISREEIARAVAEEAKAQASIKKHGVGLIAVIDDLTSELAVVREQALERIRAIRDPEMIPALERVVAGVGEEASLAVLEALAAMPEKEASLSLARFAVLSSDSRIGWEASDSLKDRKFDHFVPQLLGSMVTSTETRFGYGHGADGRLFYRQAIYREGLFAANVAVHDVIYIGSRRKDVQDPVTPWYPRLNLRTETKLSQSDFVARSAMAEALGKVENVRHQELNSRIAQCLEALTGEKFGADARRWWNWWERQNELLVQDEKPVSLQFSAQAVGLPTSWAQKFRDLGYTEQFSCFAAGTPVLTNRGEVAIERMRVGDLVLAQDVETGEIAFKPVLETTVRPPAELLRVEHEQGSFRCTGGHPFWVSGEGWVHAKRLKSGMELHALDGSVRVSDVVADGEEPTYNLIVADYANYFVTDARVLSHDNSSRQPTDAIVPGLQQK